MAADKLTSARGEPLPGNGEQPNPQQNPPKIGWIDLLVLGMLIIAFLAPRLIALGRFVTADEPTWGKRSASFYYALTDGDYANTYQDGHPGVTTMWVGALAYQLKFPDFQRIGQVELGDTKLLQLFQRDGTNPLELLATARLIMVIANLAALVISFVFARRLFGLWLAALGFLLIAFEPLYVANSRFLHTNGLLSSLMFLSILAYLDYLQFNRRLSLVISAVAAGLSFITITPGFILIPAVFLLTALSLGRHGSNPRQRKSRQWFEHLLAPLIGWGLVSLLTVFVIWPAMWVQPVSSLLGIFEYTFNMAGGSSVPTQSIEVSEPLVVEGAKYFYFYPLTYIWRTTPVVLVGLALVLAALLRLRKSTLWEPGVRRNLLLMLVYVAVYAGIMLLGDKKSDRYLLPIYLPLDLVAAAGWLVLATWLAHKYAAFKKYYLSYALLVGVVIIQAAGTMRTAPYYLTYYNSLLGGIRNVPKIMPIGWGEGLNEAALYLKEKPGFCSQRIISWYTLAYNWYSASFGCEAQPVEFTSDTSLQDYLNNYDYAIIYINQMQKNYPAELLAYLEGQPPEYSVWIDGVEYVRIYHLSPAGISYSPQPFP